MEKVGLIEIRELKNGKLKLIKKKFNTSQEYESIFDILLDPDNSTFDTRKIISTTQPPITAAATGATHIIDNATSLKMKSNASNYSEQ